MNRTLVIINPYAASGKAQQVWESIEAQVRSHFDVAMVTITQHRDELPDCLRAAAQMGVDHVLAVGGDGTNHEIINVLMQMRDERRFVHSLVPAGTGHDFARGVGMPLRPSDAVDWLARAQPRWIDIGQATLDTRTRYFLNISSAGISEDVVKRVDQNKRRYPWTFLTAVVMGILHYQPQSVKIYLDGALWYEGRIYVAAIANGTSFAQGLRIAPDAILTDGLLDVVVVRDVARTTLLWALRLAYTGDHTDHPAVKIGRAQHIEIHTPADTLGVDLDGEPERAVTITYQVLPNELQLLLP